MNKYYAKNKERWQTQYRIKNKEWRLRNKQHLADYQREYHSTRKAITNAKRIIYNVNHPERRMVNAAKKTARNLGLPFNLVWQDITIPEKCPVLGIQLTRANGYRTESSASLDRIIPSLGYVKGNVMVISWRANRIKCDATVEELEKIAAFYKCHLASKD